MVVNNNFSKLYEFMNNVILNWFEWQNGDKLWTKEEIQNDHIRIIKYIFAFFIENYKHRFNIS